MSEPFRPAKSIAAFDGAAPANDEQREIAAMADAMLAPLVGQRRSLTLVASALASVLLQALDGAPPELRRIVWRDIKTAIDADLDPPRPTGRLS